MSLIHRHFALNCMAPNCLKNEKEIQNDDVYYEMKFRNRDGIIFHIFHWNCLIDTLAKDTLFIKTGRLSQCPTRSHNCKCFQLPPSFWNQFPNREEVANKAFTTCNQLNDFDKSYKLIKTGLISPQSIEEAESEYPELKEKIVKSKPAAHQNPKPEIVSSQSLPTEAETESHENLLQHSLSLGREQLLSSSDLDHLKEYVKTNPATTCKEMQTFMKTLTGKDISKSYLLHIVKPL